MTWRAPGAFCQNSSLCLQRIREGSVIHQIQVINVGDMIESINGHRLIGCRHYEVAKMLKELPKGKMFTIKLVEPLKAFGGWKRGARCGDNVFRLMFVPVRLIIQTLSCGFVAWINIHLKLKCKHVRM